MNTDGSLNYEPHDRNTEFQLLNQRKIRMILDKREGQGENSHAKNEKTTIVFKVNREI